MSQLAIRRCRKSRRVGGRTVSAFSECSYGKCRNCRRNFPECMEQIQARRILDTAGSKILERASLPARVSADALRDELPASSSTKRRPWKDRYLLHPRLQSGLDLSRRVLVDRSAFRRRQDWNAHRSHADVERDRVLRRLRSADGYGERATRSDELRNTFGNVGLVPATRTT